jgi:hypothetical protein
MGDAYILTSGGERHLYDNCSYVPVSAGQFKLKAKDGFVPDSFPKESVLHDPETWTCLKQYLADDNIWDTHFGAPRVYAPTGPKGRPDFRRLPAPDSTGVIPRLKSSHYVLFALVGLPEREAGRKRTLPHYMDSTSYLGMSTKYPFMSPYLEGKYVDSPNLNRLVSSSCRKFKQYPEWDKEGKLHMPEWVHKHIPPLLKPKLAKDMRNERFRVQMAIDSEAVCIDPEKDVFIHPSVSGRYNPFYGMY